MGHSPGSPGSLGLCGCWRPSTKSDTGSALALGAPIQRRGVPLSTRPTSPSRVKPALVQAGGCQEWDSGMGAEGQQTVLPTTPLYLSAGRDSGKISRPQDTSSTSPTQLGRGHWLAHATGLDCAEEMPSGIWAQILGVERPLGRYLQSSPHSTTSHIHSTSISCHLPCASLVLKAPAWWHMGALPNNSPTTCPWAL